MPPLLPCPLLSLPGPLFPLSTSPAASSSDAGALAVADTVPVGSAVGLAAAVADAAAVLWIGASGAATCCPSELTPMFTAVPSLTSVPAGYLCSTTTPLGAVLLGTSLWDPTTRPALPSLAFAPGTLSPTTLGTSTDAGPSPTCSMASDPSFNLSLPGAIGRAPCQLP